MNLKRIGIITLLSVSLIFILIEFFLVTKELRQLSNSYQELSQKISYWEEENKKIEKDIAFYSIPENLSKNLLEKFNYKKPGEKMIIVVPSE